MNAIDFTVCKNDTAKKNLARETLSDIIYKAIADYFGENETIQIKDKITVGEGTDISAGTIAVCVGSVEDKNGDMVDMVATITPSIKSFNTVTNKSGKTTYAVNLGDIIEAVEERKKEIADKEAKKEAEKKKKEAEKEAKKKSK